MDRRVVGESVWKGAVRAPRGARCREKAVKTVGIICECNPFHAGHAHLITRARAAGADCVVCVMSGPFVQRGEAAVADADLRAQALIAGGADLVLELPFPYAAAPAEFFGAAGVHILHELGVDELWFGSECGDLSLLSRLATLAETPAFCARYAETASQSDGTAAAYLRCLEELSGESLTLSSNDLLGIAYLRALSRLCSNVRPVTVRRLGSAYRDTALGEGFPSATALRKAWREQGLAAVLERLPAQTRAVYAAAESPADLSYAERLILGHFRLRSAEELETIATLGGGLGTRLQNCAREAESLSELLSLAATKKYPNARLLRGIVYALTGITEADLRLPPVYTRLLSANEAGCRFLAEVRRSRAFCVATRRTDLPDTPEAAYAAELEERAYALYALCRPERVRFTSVWQRTPTIFKK